MIQLLKLYKKNGFLIHWALFSNPALCHGKSPTHPASSHLKSHQCSFNLWRTWGAVFILLTWSSTLSLLALLLLQESGLGNSIHVSWYSRHPVYGSTLFSNFSSAVATEVLTPASWKGSDRIFLVSLYGVLLKNKVNKTCRFKPWILIICLWLWGKKGNAVEMKRTWSVSEKHGILKMLWNEREDRGRVEMIWCVMNLLTSVSCR